jgi:hypothetical protein
MTCCYPTLRPYPRNSAEAAARIVALALIANGRVEAAEVAVLDALQAAERLGLTRARWHGVITELCADLLEAARPGDEGRRIPGDVLNQMLDEVDDHGTQRLVLRLCSAVVQADRQIDDGESIVLLAAIERWGLHPDDHVLLEPVLYGADFEVRPRGRAPSEVRLPRLR